MRKRPASYRYSLPRAAAAPWQEPAAGAAARAVLAARAHPVTTNSNRSSHCLHMQENPCRACGACCAAFQVSFYWRETDEDPHGSVPTELTRKLNDSRCFLLGTQLLKNKRCIALEGEIGKEVRCSIYDRRPSPCRQVQIADDKCANARGLWGLPPLSLK